jgi:hypothetical protein
VILLPAVTGSKKLVPLGLEHYIVHVRRLTGRGTHEQLGGKYLQRIESHHSGTTRIAKCLGRCHTDSQSRERPWTLRNGNHFQIHCLPADIRQQFLDRRCQDPCSALLGIKPVFLQDGRTMAGSNGTLSPGCLDRQDFQCSTPHRLAGLPKNYVLGHNLPQAVLPGKRRSLDPPENRI